MVTCPGSGNPALNLYTFGATMMGASGHGGTDIGPDAERCRFSAPDARWFKSPPMAFGFEGVLIRDPIGNASTVGLQIGPVEQSHAIFDLSPSPEIRSSARNPTAPNVTSAPA